MLTNNLIHTVVRQKSRLTLKSLDFIGAPVSLLARGLGERPLRKKSIKSKTDFAPVETHSNVSIYQGDVEPVETSNTETDVEPVETPDTTTHRPHVEPVEMPYTKSTYKPTKSPSPITSN